MVWGWPQQYAVAIRQPGQAQAGEGDEALNVATRAPAVAAAEFLLVKLGQHRTWPIRKVCRPRKRSAMATRPPTTDSKNSRR